MDLTFQKVQPLFSTKKQAKNFRSKRTKAERISRFSPQKAKLFIRIHCSRTMQEQNPISMLGANTREVLWIAYVVQSRTSCNEIIVFFKTRNQRLQGFPISIPMNGAKF